MDDIKQRAVKRATMIQDSAVLGHQSTIDQHNTDHQSTLVQNSFQRHDSSEVEASSRPSFEEREEEADN
jgi:hypothetical protein